MAAMHPITCDECGKTIDPDEWPNREDGMCECCVDADIAKFCGFPKRVSPLDAQGRTDPNPQFFAGEGHKPMNAADRQSCNSERGNTHERQT